MAQRDPLTESEDSHLLVERRSDGVMILTMNRPQARNALSPQMLLKLCDAWHEFADTKRLRVAILTGAGNEDFCAGGDLKLTMPLMTGARQPQDEWDHALLENPGKFTDGILRGYDIFKPIIAAVNGNALGGGTEMMNACDLRVASENALFGTPEVKVGLIPGGGSITRLPRQIPYAKMMEMLMVGRPFSARECLEMGLLNYVVPRGEHLQKALELAELLAANGPLAVSKVKEGVIRSSGLCLEESLQIENEVSAAVMSSRDAREGPRAFREKRKPVFTGE